MKKNIYVMVVLSILLFSCATLDQNYINDDNNKVEVDNLDLQMGYDIYNFKVDLIRNTTTEVSTSTDAQGNTSTSTSQVDVPYHYLGVRFGNGIYYDYNRNLSVDLIKFYNIDENSFNIKTKSKGFFTPTIVYTKTEESFEHEVKSLFFGGKLKANYDKNKVVIEGAFFRPETTITILDDKIMCDPKGVFGFLSKAEITSNSSNTVEFPGFWNDAVFTQTDENTISLGKYFFVRKVGKEVEFEYNGLFNSTTTYNFMKTENGFIFYNEFYYGVKVEKNKNKISIYSNDTKMSTSVID
ncbi:MAG: hypothetical protein OCD02_04680 [Spirochaetaceae bacterium]